MSLELDTNLTSNPFEPKTVSQNPYLPLLASYLPFHIATYPLSLKNILFNYKNIKLYIILSIPKL